MPQFSLELGKKKIWHGTISNMPKEKSNWKKAKTVSNVNKVIDAKIRSKKRGKLRSV